MSNFRPGIKFNEEGICYPCLSFENRKNVDWDKRWNELKNLCEKHKRDDGYYDCLITISGGKDSHYQVYLFKEILHMNPLCFMVDNLSWTKTGRDNFNNLSEVFGVDIITFTHNRKKMKEMSLKGFLENLHPNKYWDYVLYKKPLEIAKKLGISLVVWGENPNIEIGGSNHKETSNALCLIENSNEFKDLDVIFMSYYVFWNRYVNVEIAKRHGFKSLNDTQEWKREGYERFDYEQVDTLGYLVNAYCKFIKFGFSTMTELCSDAIRHSEMSQEEAIKVINEEDWKLDPIMLDDFCKELYITKEYFWKVIDKFVNLKILEKRNGVWRLKKDAV